MRFLHLGDLHLGKTLADFDLIDDQRYILKQLLKIAVEHQVEAILIAGDVYDKSIPSEAAVRLFDEFLRNIRDAGMSSYVISGNHDSDERLNFASSLLRAQNVYMAGRYDGAMLHHRTEDAFGPLNIYLMPFIKASQVRRFYPDAEIENYNDAVRTVIENSSIDPNARNLLIAHQFVSGGAGKPLCSGSESLSTRSVGLVEQVNAGVFSAFDYVALGHIHSNQAIERETIRYSGSPLKYSLSEVDSTKYAVLVELKEKGEVELCFEELKPMRDLRKIEGPMQQLLKPENLVDTQDLMYVVLTDENPPDNAKNIIGQYYPNTVRLEISNSHTKELELEELSPVEEEISFTDIIREFYQKVYGAEIREEEMKLILEVAREAGVDIETD